MKKAPIVHVEFYDHNQSRGDDMGVAKIDLYGVLIKEDKQAYYVASWVCDSVIDHNSDCYTILKHKGLKIKRLK